MIIHFFQNLCPLTYILRSTNETSLTTLHLSKASVKPEAGYQRALNTTEIVADLPVEHYINIIRHDYLTSSHGALTSTSVYAQLIRTLQRHLT